MNLVKFSWDLICASTFAQLVGLNQGLKPVIFNDTCVWT